MFFPNFPCADKTAYSLKFEIYKAGIVAEYNLDMIKVDFGFDTNIPELVKACGKPRLIFPAGLLS